jgi:tetratricopeptide (TPR) repeat protein
MEMKVQSPEKNSVISQHSFGLKSCYGALKRHHLWTLLIFAGVTIAVYGQCLGHQFVNWDDLDYVTNNPVVKGITFDNFREAFTRFFVGNYAPVQILSYMVDHALWGMRAGGFLFTNILCHLLSGVLFFYLVLRIDGRDSVAFLAAILFLVHPVQVESVAWVTERKTLLAMVFFLASFHSYISFRDSGTSQGRWHLFSSLVFFLLASLAKSVVVILPAVLVLYDLGIRQDRIKTSLKLHKLPYLAIAILTAWLALESQSSAVGGGRTGFHGGSFATNALTMFPVFVRYLGLLVWPANLNVVYTPAIRTHLDLVVILSLLLLLTIAVATVFLYRQGNQLAFWISLFFIGLAPVSQVVPLVTLMNDRYLYFPMLGGATLFASLLVALKKRTSPFARVGAYFMAGLIVIVLAGLAYQRARVWQNSVILWDDAYRKNPVAQTEYYLGMAYRDNGDLQKAIPYLQQAVESEPSNKLPLAILADIYLRLGQLENGTPLVESMKRKFPGELNTWMNDGNYALQQGAMNRAEMAFLKALRIDPGNPDALYGLGNVYSLTNRLKQAKITFLEALQSSPYKSEVFYELARVEVANGNYGEALNDLQQAMEKGLSYPQRLLSDRTLEPLRNLPQFQQLLIRMNMPALHSDNPSS